MLKALVTSPASIAGNFFRRGYFFLLTFFVFFAVFFTALFAFFAFLAFLAMLPSDLVMAWSLRASRESICTTSRIHQHIRKNSVPLKEVLTSRDRRMQRAFDGNATARVRGDANNARKHCIGVCQDCRKCLCPNSFVASLFERMLCGRPRCDSSPAMKGPLRGL